MADGEQSSDPVLVGLPRLFSSQELPRKHPAPADIIVSIGAAKRKRGCAVSRRCNNSAAADSRATLSMTRIAKKMHNDGSYSLRCRKYLRPFRAPLFLG
jgi:hypothetical protein